MGLRTPLNAAPLWGAPWRLMSAPPLLLSFLSLPRCDPSPGPCNDLDVGDQIVMTVQEVEGDEKLACDLAEIGIAPETVIDLYVDELVPNRGGEWIDVSTGTMRVGNGWYYEKTDQRPDLSATHSTVLRASKGLCSGYLWLELFAEEDSSIRSATLSVFANVSYSPLDWTSDCPYVCRGLLKGTAALAP